MAKQTLALMSGIRRGASLTMLPAMANAAQQPRQTLITGTLGWRWVFFINTPTVVEIGLRVVGDACLETQKSPGKSVIFRGFPFVRGGGLEPPPPFED
jgi:hypothetical protein